VSASRHLLAIALLPGTVTVLVPALLVDGPDVGGVTLALGIVLISGGFALWLWTVLLFARIGRGTLAPWDPTQRLVAQGPYRHVRNPMITAVLFVLLGEAALFRSTALLIWAAVFFAVNHAYFVLVEEPGLVRRFGAEYEEYRRAVPRWLPRATPQ
jgi:protein-S-isoprenylcysteine O-methyltransferase Ste14